MIRVFVGDGRRPVGNFGGFFLMRNIDQIEDVLAVHHRPKVLNTSKHSKISTRKRIERISFGSYNRSLNI